MRGPISIEKSNNVATEMSELKPCPFCGINARVEQLGGKYTVGCVTVDCIGHYYSGKLYKDQAAAVEAWNRRAKND